MSRRLNVQGHMLYQSNIYFSGYLHQIEGDMDVAPLGCKFHQQIEKRGVVGKGIWTKVKGKILYCN